MRIVLDTNVLVSGLLSPFGPPGEIVRLVSSGLLTLCLDARIVAEYEEVLHLPSFAFDRDAVATLIDYIEAGGETVAPQPLVKRLPDRDDEPFLEVALAARAECLVTGNMAHFPPEARAGVTVLSPTEMIERYRGMLAEIEAGESATAGSDTGSLDRLVAEGRATPATGSVSALSKPPRSPDGNPTLSDVLKEMRAEETR